MDWQTLSDFIESSFWFLVSTSAIIAVFIGSRNIFRGHLNKDSIRLFISGAVICIAFSLFGFFVANELSELSRLVNKERPQATLDGSWGNDLHAKERTERSKLLASVYLRDKGKITSYFNFNGEREDYCPTESDITVRDLQVKTQCDLSHAIVGAENKGWNWLFQLISSIFLGWLASTKEFDKFYRGLK